mgnify:CR=1 FL=1
MKDAHAIGRGEAETGEAPDIVKVAAEYEAGGAHAISVLTEERRFHGSLADQRPHEDTVVPGITDPEASVRGEKRLLDRVLGLPHRAEHPIAMGEQLAAIGLVLRLLGGGVAEDRYWSETWTSADRFLTHVTEWLRRSRR